MARADLVQTHTVGLAGDVELRGARLEEVDATLETARAAGASVHDAERRDWGGYSGYFADPDGFRWEVAHNPHAIGGITLP
jgi:hypothetical protein